MSSNYYDLLGVSRSDSYNKVRHSYRKLVKKHHPDVSDLPNAQERFQQIKAAYEVLNHPQKREKYNQISHNEFVSQCGGYTSEEIEKVTEVQLINKGKVTSKTTSSQSKRCNQRNPAEHKRNQDKTGSAGTPWYYWILQGRTAEKNGFPAYALRLATFCVLVYIVFSFLGIVFIDATSTFYFTVGILVSRAIYLILFESLRKSHDKIDDSPDPDAYSIPYSVGIVIIGIVLLGLSLLFTPLFAATGILLVVSVVLFGLGALLVPIGYMGTILAVGWGVADDYYNLQLNVRPAFWNFLVQAPILVAFTVLFWGTPTVQLLMILAMLPVPLLVGVIYTNEHHNEIISGIISKLISRTVNRLTV